MKSNDAIDDETYVKEDFSDMDLKKVKIGFTSFEKCIFNNTDFSESGFVSVVFKDCSFVGTQFYKSLLRDCEFVDCRFELASFFGIKNKKNVFESCELKDTDFSQSEIQKLKFESSILDKVNFGGLIKSKDIDFRTSSLVELSGFDKLKGAIISPDQLVSLAPQLASQLGLKVVE